MSGVANVMQFWLVTAFLTDKPAEFHRCFIR